MDDESKIKVSSVGKLAQGKCCFCSQTANVVASEINPEKTICFRCIHKINFQLGKIPAGSVYCFKCKSIAGFQLEMQRGGQHVYLMAGRDFKGCVKYMKKDKDQVIRAQVKKITCTACKSTIPKWALEATSHV